MKGAELETQRALLGILMSTPGILRIRQQVAALVRPEYFAPRERVVYEAILSQSEDAAIDHLTTIAAIPEAKLGQIGGEDWIEQLVYDVLRDDSKDFHLADEYARIIAEAGEKRQRHADAEAIAQDVIAGRDGLAHQRIAKLLTERAAARKTAWSWSELRAATFPEPRWAIPGIIPTGLSTIGGRPKIGKSWLAMQIACAVGTGGIVLDRCVEKGRVLYLALEDSPRRLQDRAKKQNWPANAAVDFCTDWPFLADGGASALRTIIEQEKYTLAVIDTLTRALGAADQNDVAVTALAIGELQDIAQERGATILTVDHHRKPSGLNPDPVDDLFGSTGKSMPLDGVCGLYRERGKKEAIFRVTGRDVEEIDLALVFDGLTGCWQISQEQGQPKKDSQQDKVLQAIRDLEADHQLAYSISIANKTGLDAANVRKVCAALLQRGLIAEGPPQGTIKPFTALPREG